MALALVAQLRLVQVADALQADRPAEEVRQDLRRDQVGRKGKYGKVDGDRTMADIAEAPRRSLELPVHRRHVVPGSVQLRLPPHRDVHHPVCHAGGRDLLLRLQHRHRLAQHHREDAHDGDAHQVVRGARPPRDLRRRQDGAARLDRALAEAERRSGPRRRADRPRRPRHRQERARREARGAQAQDARGRREEAAPQRGDGQALSRSTCSRSSRRCRFRASAARRRRRSRRKCCTSRSCSEISEF